MLERRSFRKFESFHLGEKRKPWRKLEELKAKCPKCGEPGSGPYLKTHYASPKAAYLYWSFKHYKKNSQGKVWCYLGKLGNKDFNDIIDEQERLQTRISDRRTAASS